MDIYIHFILKTFLVDIRSGGNNDFPCIPQIAKV